MSFKMYRDNFSRYLLLLIAQPYYNRLVINGSCFINVSSEELRVLTVCRNSSKLKLALARFI